MKSPKIIIHILVLLLVAYGSVCLGFLKGYSYAQGERLTDAFSKMVTLNHLRAGETSQAIQYLEFAMDANIISYHVSDQSYIKLLFWLPQPRESANLKILKDISAYKQSTSFKCNYEQDICSSIEATLNGSQNP